MAWEDRDYYRGGGRGRSGGSSGGGAGGGLGGGDVLRRLNAFFSRTLPIGTYLGISVRVNILFFLLPLYFFLTLKWLPPAMRLQYTVQFTALLFLSVLLHEFGHALGCRSVGGEADHILMWPLGGLAYVSPPRRPWPQFVTVACGPLVNVALAGAALAALAAMGQFDAVSLNPLSMWVSRGSSRLVDLVAQLYAVNYALLCFNLALVFYPFDGGRLVQIGLWKLTDYRTSMLWATRVGMAGAVLVALFAIVDHLNVLLLSIAVMGFVACYQQGKMLRYAELDGDATAGEQWKTGEGLFAPDEPTARPGALARWQSRRRAKRQTRADRKRQKERQKEAALLAEVDRILAKVKERGLQSLSEREKKTLQEATDRQKRAG